MNVLVRECHQADAHRQIGGVEGVPSTSEFRVYSRLTRQRRLCRLGAPSIPAAADPIEVPPFASGIAQASESLVSEVECDGEGSIGYRAPHGDERGTLMDWPISQEEYFSSTGGDDYFERNAVEQGTPQRSLMAYELLNALPSGALPHDGRAAVLGGAAGGEAAALSELLPGWKLANVDVSARAIEFGKVAFPEIDHHCLSIATAMPDLHTAIGEQDLVFVVGVMLWLDRKHLARAIANIDGSLRDGGHLLISDYLPSTRRKNPIRYSPKHYTYKQDYSAPFLSLGTYELVAMNTRVTAHPEDLDTDERRGASHLLRKNLTELYPIGWTG